MSLADFQAEMSAEHTDALLTELADFECYEDAVSDLADDYSTDPDSFAETVAGHFDVSVDDVWRNMEAGWRAAAQCHAEQQADRRMNQSDNLRWSDHWDD